MITKPMQVRRTMKSDRTWYDVKSGTIPKSHYMVCSRYSGVLIDPWIMLFSLFWPGGMQMKVTREPLNNSRISCFGSCTFICFSSPNYFTAKTQVLDHGQRRRLRRARKPGHQLTVAAGGAERCKDLFSLFRILQKEIMSGMYSRSLCCGRLKNQRIRTEIEWRLQVFGVFWMHCCELQVHSLTTNRVAEHGDSWALILFCCKWAKAQEGVTSHWHAFTPAALSSSSALFSWWMIDIHGIFQMVSSCFLEYSMVDMHGIFYRYMVSSHSHRCTCFTIQGSPLSCHLPRPPTWRYLRPQLIGNPESLMFLNISSYAGGKARLYQAIPGILQLLVVSKMPKYHK